jgi:signal transduction histidine kinase/ActR/RegA family two-component response regulator
MVVENRDEGDIPRAAWMFPLYLVAINLFVVPLAVTGSLLFPDGAIDRDMTVLALPLAAGANGIALLTFIGGLSAATAMVIVASVALAIMVSNHLVMPVALRWRRLQASRLTASEEIAPGADMGGLVLFVRRVSIVSIVLLGYLYYRAAGSAALAAIGLLSFAAVAQIAPAFFAGLVWRRGTALGAGAGLLAGLACWAYTLLLPTLAEAAPVFATTLEHGPFGITALKPTALFGLELPRLTHGVVVSLGVNLVAYVVFSLLRPAEPMERLQASAFVDPSGTPMAPAFRPRRLPVTVEELRNAVARYLGSERAMSSFDSFAASRGLTLDLRGQADPHLLRYAEHLLSSAIGAASARLVLSLLLKRGNVSGAAALKLLDDASAALQYDRDLLQNALDHARQGISLFDRHLRLLAWNRAFVRLYDLPDGFVRVGLGLDEIVRFNAERGLYGEGDREEIVSTRLESFVNETRPVRLRLPTLAKVIEIRSSPLPEGGVVTTYTDITQEVEAEEALARANETLEGRVRERTRELERLNRELSRAKSAAEEANTSKTRFLAAASHDILQPLNAARLYATALADKTEAGPLAGLARNVDGSLEAVEEILGALLDISRLDAGAMKPEFTSFRIDDILAQLKLEFAPLAREKGLDLRFVSSSLSVRSDRRLLRRLLQNLVSNAIKYTPRGKVLVGCRRQRGKVVVEVRDTGVGIPGSKQKLVFQEFQRLDEGARVARGLGLGLSIVERIARVVGAPVRLSSEVGRGSAFSVMLPLAAALPEATSQRETAADTAGSLAGTIVLAIDNEPAILDGMRTLLNGWGCEVLTAAGLKEAVQLLRRRKVVPHLMIADYHLDDGDGIEAVVALRWRIGRDAPAILATADRSVEVRDKAADAGIDVLHKPIRPAALRALIARKRSLLAAAE